MLALSALCEGFAGGLVTLHAPPLLGRIPSSGKSRVSITSKLIEIKALQAQHFGHLRKIGGKGELPGGTYHASRRPKNPPLTPVFPHLARPILNLNIFNVLEPIGGWSGHTKVRSQTGPPRKTIRDADCPPQKVVPTKAKVDEAGVQCAYPSSRRIP
jgi:hypothetical protein